MEQPNVNLANHPVLLIPKECPNLAVNLESNDGSCINVNITSTDIHGNNINIYSGICTVRFMEQPMPSDDGVEVIIHSIENNEDEIMNVVVDSENAEIPIHYVEDLDNDIIETVGSSPMNVIEDNYIVDPLFSQTQQMWADAQDHIVKSYPHNEKNIVEIPVNQSYEVIQHSETNIATTLVTYSGERERKHNEIFSCNDLDISSFQLYEEAELEYSDILSKMAEVEKGLADEAVIEEIVTEDSNFSSDVEKKGDELNALKQLMSPKTLSAQKQSKTIVFVAGQGKEKDIRYGQTIQKISINDPSIQCHSKNAKVVMLKNKSKPSQWKYYQCDHCKSIFEDMSEFRQHIKEHTKKETPPAAPLSVCTACKVCGVTLRSQKKVDLHARGHGDPELECDICQKVFSSKFILRSHYKTHLGKYPCKYCRKKFTEIVELRIHLANRHFLYLCDFCDYVAKSITCLEQHLSQHLKGTVSKTDFGELYVNGEASVSNNNDANEENAEDSKHTLTELTSVANDAEQADSVIAKVMSNQVFLQKLSRTSKSKKQIKMCEVCMKSFDRASGLKRHLIEHVVKSTLAKTPVGSDGTLDILCDVCRGARFNDIVKYKAHLRIHAKLTIYQCHFCNKSFSDSSNFSKHKKIHGGGGYFQCDLCARKFYSRRMISQHMEHHMMNDPIHCAYCDKEFHFESNLNKHIKSAHTKETIKFRCRFCYDCFSSLRMKWEHEWEVHNVRKVVIDCTVCGLKFRKLSDLRTHCASEHDDTSHAKRKPVKLLRKKTK